MKTATTETTKREREKPTEANFDMKDIEEAQGTLEKKEMKAAGLPVRKFNSPVAAIRCWHCKGQFGKRPLRNVRNTKGVKTKDYICDICFMTGVYAPTIGNQSEMKFQYAAN